jgi:hypothetical protein
MASHVAGLHFNVYVVHADFRRDQIFRDVVDLEWGLLNLVRITEELLQ